MHYLLVYLLSGDAEKFHNKTVREVTFKFDVNHVLNQDIAPHITLKYPFETNNIEELEDFLVNFCNNQVAEKIELDGFNHFDDRVVFMKVKFSKAALKVYESLYKELKKFAWMQWDKFDSVNMKFHSTIASDDINNKFDAIFNFLKEKDYRFELKFDNISILKYENEHWDIYRKFKIK